MKQNNLSTEEFLNYNGISKEQLKDLVFERIEEMVEQHYKSLPDGVHKHADGELYIHQTYSDPRTNASFKSISKL